MTLQQAQTWYLEETVATATPAKLLTLLYDRLAKDVGQARAALLGGERERASRTLEHAREILLELMTTLDAGAWDGAADLARIYTWMASQLIAADIRGDHALLSPVHAMVVDLGQAWHGAANVVDARTAASA